MNVSVRLGYGIANQHASARFQVNLPDAATVAELIDHLRRQHPELDGRLEVALPVISGKHVSASQPLEDGEEVALLLPAAGGSGQ